MHFQEGDIIQISLIRETGLNEAEQFYLFQTKEGDKFLLDQSMYKHYNFTPGQIIQARIDRINCSGKIFIEPEHPLYKDLHFYDFSVSDIRSISQDANIVVEDCFNNSVPVKVHPEKAKQNSLKLGVAFVRKGVPVLFDPDLDKKFSYKEREIYSFKIKNIKPNREGEEEIILCDEEGILQYLPAHFYSHYQFKKDQNIRCEIVRILPGRRLSLEPIHPYLIKGELVHLTYVSLLSEEERKFHRHKLHKLRDENGQIFLLSDRFLNEDLKKGIHQYKIDAFKKGQVYVEPDIS